MASVAVENKKTQWPIVEAGQPTELQTRDLAAPRLRRTKPMSRRQRTAPKANISPSVRLGLTSIVAGNEAGIRTMLSAAASDDLVEKLAEPHVERGLPSSATARQPSCRSLEPRSTCGSAASRRT